MTRSKQDERRIVIATPEGQRDAVKAVLDLDASSPWVVTIAPHRPKRSVSANALFHAWMAQMSVHFTARGYAATPAEMKTLMKHKHLGYTDEQVIGSTVIPATLRSTAELSVTEFCEFMTRIDAWALDQGVYLVTPAASQYADYKEARV